MEAQRILIRLHDEADGYAVSPGRVPLGLLRAFAKDVDEFIRGDGAGPGTVGVEVAVVHGSLGIHTAPLADPVLLGVLRLLASSESIDELNPRRRSVVARWQKTATGPRRPRFEISAPMLERPIVISADTDYRADDADQWVRVERYVRGEIEDLGGSSRVNAHIRLPDGKLLTVDTEREVLRSDEVNRLYKLAMVRISAEFNVVTTEYRSARLIEFVEHDTRVDERELERLFQRGAKAWKDMPDATVWVENQRGNDV